MRIDGYASLFGEIDSARDVVEPGAFVASLADRRASEVRMLLQHNPSTVVGVWLNIAEDHKGLAVHGRLLPGLWHRAGSLPKGLSIGFRATESFIDPKSGIRRISRIDLYEISLVMFPMLAGAILSNGTARAGAVQ